MKATSLAIGSGRASSRLGRNRGGANKTRNARKTCTRQGRCIVPMEEDTEMEFTQEHEGIRRGVKKFIDAEINPHIDAWEEAGIFPAHELFKKMGDQGYL